MSEPEFARKHWSPEAQIADLRSQLTVAIEAKEKAERERDQSRIQEMRNYMASPAMHTFADLKHSQAGTVLAMLGDGYISRGKCCEVLAQLAHGIAFDDIPLPAEHDGYHFGEDEIPAELVSTLTRELNEARATIMRMEAEAVGLRKDKARFEWWLSPETSESGFEERLNITSRLRDTAPLDQYREAIDAAMSAQEPK